MPDVWKVPGPGGLPPGKRICKHDRSMTRPAAWSSRHLPRKRFVEGKPPAFRVGSPPHTGELVTYTFRWHSVRLRDPRRTTSHIPASRSARPL